MPRWLVPARIRASAHSHTDGHPERVTPGCNFSRGLFPKGCRRVTFLLAKLQTCSSGAFAMPLVAMRILEKSAATGLRVLLAGAMLSISPVAALAANTNFHPGFAGIYVTRAPKTAPTMSVSLGADGSATVTQDPGQGSTTLFGRWQDDGHQIKVTFDASEGEPVPAPMV